MDNFRKIITIDGPAGVGKSTIAKIIADELRIPFLNTGAMFRYLALYALKKAGQSDSEDLLSELGQCHFSLQGTGNDTILLCNENPVGEETRTEAVARLASRLATRPEVRKFLLAAQQKIGQETDLVAEGRDMGTIVFPYAPYKFFLDARPNIRAQRRWLELKAAGQTISIENLEKEIRERDYQDRTRAIAPLAPASDALVIDTSSLTINEVTDKILQNIKIS